MVDFPAFLETESGQFKAAAEATVAEWRAAKRIEKGWRRRLISKMLKLADGMGLAENAPLLCCLRAQSNTPGTTTLQ
jgi:hypothetical protein